MLYPINLLNILNGSNLRYDSLQLSNGMDAKIDGAVDDIINSLGMKRVNRQVELLCNAVNDVTQKVLSVDSQNLDGHGIESVWAILIVNGHNRIAML